MQGPSLMKTSYEMVLQKGGPFLILKKKQLAKRFNRAAKTYDLYAEVPRKMAHRLVYTCQKMKIKANRILEIGCGTGYCTSLLQNLYPEAEIDGIDFAEKMVQEAKRIIDSSRVHFQIADAEEEGWESGKKYDLIVLNAVIHWLSNPLRTLKRCYDLLTPGGFFLATTFGPDTFQETKKMFEKVELDHGIEPTSHTLPLSDAAKWEERMKQAKYGQISIEEHWLKEHYQDCRHFFQTIKATGANYCDNKQPIGLSRKILPEMMERYNVYFRDRVGVYATFHLIQILGKREIHTN